MKKSFFLIRAERVIPGRLRRCMLIVIAIFLLNFLHAEIKILNPREGVWSNKQALVIQDFPNENGDYYYSLDGSDPESFGFAYDGPVLLDVAGDVCLKIAFIEKSGEISKADVNFSVIQNDADDADYRNFVKTFYSSGIVNYSSGSDFVIPDNLSYCFDSSFGDFLPGTALKLSSENVVTRYVPCTVFDASRNLKYRFAIKTFPQSAGVYTKRDLPFSIEDWETIFFNDKNLIYKIDSEFWGLPTEPVKLDRSVSHMISWQSLDYSKGNSVEFYILPPKPQIVFQKNDDGSVVYFAKGDDSHNLSVYSREANDYFEFFPKIGIDAFAGEKISGSLDIGIFSNFVYQGKIVVEYNINKSPPAAPKINVSAKSFYSRENVRVEVSCDSSDELYVALSEPYSLSRDGKIYAAESEELQNIAANNFRKAKSNKFAITWDPKNMQPVFYKLCAYSKNEQNVSKIAEYGVIIDKFGCYFDKNADPKNAQGTVENPYANFDQCYNDLKNVRAIALRVKGDLEINKKYVIESNFEIINDKDARVIFGEGGSFILKGASLEISDCRISSEGASNSAKNVPLIRLENAVLTMNNCQIGADFAKNGTIIDSFNSIVNVADSIVSANAISYVSFISGVKSRINVKNSAITTFADVNVIISASEGAVSAKNNEFTVAGRSGRAAELFGVKADFTENNFRIRLSNGAGQIIPIYEDEKTELIQKDNSIYGF